MGPVDFPVQNFAAKTPEKAPAMPAPEDARSDIAKRFEQMLWAEMLRHTGQEDALTRSGGQGTEAFTQFVIEAIAEDIAEQHPLGLDPIPVAAEAYARLDKEGKAE